MNSFDPKKLKRNITRSVSVASHSVQWRLEQTGSQSQSPLRWCWLSPCWILVSAPSARTAALGRWTWPCPSEIQWDGNRYTSGPRWDWYPWQRTHLWKKIKNRSSHQVFGSSVGFMIMWCIQLYFSALVLPETVSKNTLFTYKDLCRSRQEENSFLIPGLPFCFRRSNSSISASALHLLAHQYGIWDHRSLWQLVTLCS